MMPLTGSSREMGNFYDLSWGSDGWFLSPCVHGLFVFFFLWFLKSSIFCWFPLADLYSTVVLLSLNMTHTHFLFRFFVFQVTVLTFS